MTNPNPLVEGGEVAFGASDKPGEVTTPPSERKTLEFGFTDDRIKFEAEAMGNVKRAYFTLCSAIGVRPIPRGLDQIVDILPYVLDLKYIPSTSPNSSLQLQFRLAELPRAFLQEMLYRVVGPTVLETDVYTGSPETIDLMKHAPFPEVAALRSLVKNYQVGAMNLEGQGSQPNWTIQDPYLFVLQVKPEYRPLLSGSILHGVKNNPQPNVKYDQKILLDDNFFPLSAAILFHYASDVGKKDLKGLLSELAELPRKTK